MRYENGIQTRAAGAEGCGVLRQKSWIALSTIQTLLSEVTLKAETRKKK